MILYAIRHIPTGKLMPLFPRNVGYTHWNPTQEWPKYAVPRFFASELAAKIAISWWTKRPRVIRQDYYVGGMLDTRLVSKDNIKRNQKELQIVKFNLRHG